MNAAELADMIIARFRENINLVNESEVLVKDKAKVACRVTGIKCMAIDFEKLFLESNK